MIKRLSEQGLLEHLPYRGVVLTADGRRLALRTVRRHRLIESYLVAYLGYSWDAVHDEAERLEHAISDELAERMASALGNPGVDPHGDPIPTADGDVAEIAGIPLSEAPAGIAMGIRRVNEHEAERLLVDHRANVFGPIAVGKPLHHCRERAGIGRRGGRGPSG